MRTFYWRAFAVLLMLAAGTGCLFDGGGDDDSTDGPPVPAVVSVVPADGANHVQPQVDIQVEFSVDMDASSVEAATTLSDPTRGNVSFAAEWIGPSVLVIDPEGDLSPGVLYTLTIAATAESDEGKPLAAAFTSDFTTLPSYPVVLSTYPEDGATAVSINASARIEFSMTMDSPSTLAAISVDPDTDYTPVFAGDNVTLDFAANLAASTTYTVTVDASAAAEGPGELLGVDYVFSFTTGAGADTTPPTILSYSPANGATNVSVNIGELVITFSEPILEGIEPQSIDLRFYALVYTEPTMSPDGTQLTVPLLRLPPGCELWVDLGPFQDAVGNWSADPPRFSFTTAGTADFFPAGVGDWWEYYAQSGGGGENQYLISTANVGGGDFDLNRYRPAPPGRQPEDYTELDQISHYSRTASVLYWDGRSEPEGVGWMSYSFTPPVEWLHFPLTLGLDWQGNATFSMGDTNARVSYTVEVTDVGDYSPPIGRPAPQAGWPLGGERQLGSLVFPDCAEVTLSYTLEAYIEGSWQVQEEGGELDLYCPGLGLVKMHSEGTSYGEGGPEEHSEDANLAAWLVGQ